MGKTKDEVAERASYFRHVITDHLASRALRGKVFDYHENVHILLAEVYFAITFAYKEIYLKPGHGTDKIKQAAFVCAAISSIAPLRPTQDVDPNNIEDMEYFFANPMMAIKAGCTLVRHPFEARSFDDKRRAYDALRLLQLDCVDSIRVEARQNNGITISDWQLNLSPRDQGVLANLVLDFSMYSQMTEANRFER